MIAGSIESRIPLAIRELIGVISNGSLTLGLIIIIVAVLMLIFSRYFKYIFIFGYIILAVILMEIMQNLDVKFQLALIIAFLIFMPFLYFGIKYSFSLTTVNIMMFGYVMIFYPFFKNSFTDPVYTSIFILLIFSLSIITFYLILKLKLRSAFIRGEEA
ncbi:MAG: hypothetical protein ACP5RZ_02330 [Thermoplasmata archaeon]